MEIAVAHQLQLSYESKCNRLHGHNLIVTVYCKSEEINSDGMVCDFKHIKHTIHGKLDHTFLNNQFTFNPTAENLSRWITEQFPECYKAEVQESDGNIAVYVDDHKTDGREAL